MRPHKSNALLLDCSTAVNIIVPVQECVGLVDLYNNTNGPSWTTSTNRDTDTNVCDWFGVDCTLIGGEMRVTTLNLLTNNLVGTLPASMSGLAHMLVMDLSQNGLTGTLPSSWSTMTGIQALQIYSNSI
ncbi:hypothetical protein KBC03_05140 [Patescibacteria group bacterium]|nr:hypothetical protein [Patescibacteria group bacterium]